MNRTSRIYTVNGVTANMAEHCRRYGKNVSLVHKRVVKMKWSIEQALGLATAPPRKLNNRGWNTQSATRPLMDPSDIIADVMMGTLSGEEYLRLEGVPEHGPPLSARDAFEVECDDE